MSESVPDRETVENIEVGDDLVFNDREEPYHVVEVRERERLPITLDHTDPRPWTKTLKLVGPGADRRDESKWKIVYREEAGGEPAECKLRYHRRDSDEIRMGGQWTGHGDVETLELIEEPDLPEQNEETGVYMGHVPVCPSCHKDTSEIGRVGEVDPEEVNEDARYRVFWIECPECSHSWYERSLKNFDSYADITQFMGEG